MQAMLRTALGLVLMHAMFAPVAAATTADDVGGCGGFVPLRIVAADPATYLAAIAALQPGDLVQLAAGTYPSGLSLHGVSGQPESCIIIEGPATGPPAVFTGRDCCNTVSLEDASYLVIRNLTLDGQGRAGDGVKAEGTAAWVHHITLENLSIVGHGADQQIVGISTKAPAWNWVIRRNVIVGAGTGMYLGNSNGEDELSNSLIEYNLVMDTVGYNLQVKHQNGRATGLGAPVDGTTVIRHNVFSKAAGGSTGGDARPNVLLGHWPLTGPGSDDDYLVYGNFFWSNPNEALLQAEGNVWLYDNLLVNRSGPAIHIQPHNDLPQRIRVFHNTVIASSTGISVSGGDPAYQQRVLANAVFASPALSGGDQVANVAGVESAAGTYLQGPDGVPGDSMDPLDLRRRVGELVGPPPDLGDAWSAEDADLDFDWRPRDGTVIGAYVSALDDPSWWPALERKPESWAPVFADGFETGGTGRWSAGVPRVGVLQPR